MTNQSPNQFPEEWLSAYLDGELSQEQRLLVEVGVAQNPQLAQFLEELRATRQLVRQLPIYANSVAQRSANSPSDTWTSELDDGLDLGQGDGLSDNSNDGASQDSLTTSSEQQLLRRLADDSDDITIFHKHKPSRINFRWVSLAASMIGIAILALVLWPSKNGHQLVTNSDRQSPERKTVGRVGDAFAEESLDRAGSSATVAADSAAADGQPDSESRAANLGRREETGSMEFRLQASETLEAFKADRSAAFPPAPSEAPTDPMPANLPTAPSVLSELAADLNVDPPAAVSQDKSTSADLLGQAQIGLRGLEAEMPSPSAKAEQKQALQAAEVLPPPQNTPSRALARPPGAIESMKVAPLNRNSASAAPKRSLSVSAATKATWHRSGAWSDQAVIGQIETNTILYPLRSMLQGTYAAQQVNSPLQQSIPIVVLKADDRLRKELPEKLQSIITPAWSESSESTTRVVFLSKDELEQALGSLIKPVDLFWVVPTQQDSSSQLRILILNEG
jgi:hypothetical protein